MSTAITSHIRLDERGRAWIDDTNTKVVEVVLDKLAHGSSPEEMHAQYPHLSLAQIHAALSYYYDHKAEFDAEIERDRREVERLRAESRDQPTREQLLEKARAKGIRLGE